MLLIFAYPVGLGDVTNSRWSAGYFIREQTEHSDKKPAMYKVQLCHNLHRDRYLFVLHEAEIKEHIDLLATSFSLVSCLA